MTLIPTWLLTACVLLDAGDAARLDDLDGDGFLAPEDCDDRDPGVHPYAEESWYDGIDQDCDGNDADQDLDGELALAVGGTDCWDDPYAIPADFRVVAGQGFSQPAALEVNSAAEEIWYDGVDQDCDGASDFDQDGDGYEAAAHPNHQGELGDDCVDNDDELAALAASDSWAYAGEITPAEIHPGRSADDDTCYDGLNLDCQITEPAADNDYPEDYDPDFDCDGDGFHLDTDCDDSDAAVYPDPSIEEVWYNGVDENCDNNDGDQDNDGFDSWVVGGEDCWDDPTLVPADSLAINGFSQPDASDVNPDEPDTWYDGIDQDCADDDDFDADRDSFGTDAYANRDGETGTDCDDTDATTYAGATEYCDDLDHDCDGLIEDDDDAIDGIAYYLDEDGDSYGTTTSRSLCEPSGDFSADNSDDCDDSDPSENPDADEVCDGDDDDCDGDIDEDGAIDVLTWYRDADSDGFGNPDSTDIDCFEPLGYTSNSTDCDDDDSTTNPGADEYCDGGDDDCDGQVDEDGAVDALTWYEDADGDSYGNPDSTDIDCYEPSGYTEDNSDCDDGDSTVNPDQTEICDDGLDNDCDGETNGCERSGAFGIETVSDVQVRGSQNNALTGHVVRAGDLDGDGDLDLATAGYGWDSGSEVSAGAVWAFEGPVASGEHSTDDATWSHHAEVANDYAGYAMDLGDVTADGIADILVGAFGDDTTASGAGVVYLVPGGSTTGSLDSSAVATIAGDGGLDNLGTGVGSVGDIDGDGVADLVVGAWEAAGGGSGAGAAYLFLGPLSGPSLAGDADQSWVGAAVDANLGWSIAGLGDLDGDGLSDFAVSAIDDADSGSPVVEVLYGASSPSLVSGYTVTGEAGSRLGYVLEEVGDLTGDGYDDVGLGAPDASGGGAAYVLEGPLTSDRDLTSGEYFATFTGSGRAGYAVGTAGDLDNDGHSDLGVSGSTYSSSAGALWVMYGPVGSGGYDLDSTADLRLQGTDSNDLLGVSFHHGDLSGDGIDDLVVGAQSDEEGGTGTGSTYVVLGAGL